jgi:hypothetical protein
MKCQFIVLVALMLAAGMAAGQTQVDLRVQSKNIDFSQAPSTLPWKSGTVLPALCTTGQAFFKTDAVAGSNVYACTATNIWTLQSGGSGGGGGGGSVNSVTAGGGGGVIIGGTSTDPTVQGDPSAIGFLQGLNNWGALQVFGKNIQISATSTDPICVASGDIGKMWIDNTSSTTTHFRVCGNVASTPTWVAVF